jgi:hypothetical protein
MDNKQSAERLAEQVATYWQIHGYTGIKTWVVAERTVANDNIGTVYGVRSNLVGGLPPRDQAA